MKKVWKVFTINKDGYEDYGYCYSKQKALDKRSYWQSLGIIKVMIKGRH